MIDATRFAVEYEAGFPKTVGFLYRSSCGEAEDIAQMAWARAWERRAQFQGGSSFLTWVGSIAVNELRGRRRQGQRRRHHLSSHRPRTVVASHEGAIVAALTSERLLASMPLRVARCIELRAVEGFTYRELAQMFGSDAATLKLHVHRGVRGVLTSTTRYA